MMHKLIPLYLFLFIAILGVNTILITKLNKHNQRIRQARNIFSEIDYSIKKESSASAPLVLGTSAFAVEPELSDSRAANLKSFFRKYNSPLYDYADLIVKVSDENKFDYRLIPAIAMQESTLCKKIPENSYNCWGWGIYGSKITKFSSYDEAITTVGSGLRKNYIDKGLVTASAIMDKYTPSSQGSWANGVNTVLGWLE